MSSARERQKKGAAGVSASWWLSVRELRWVGWITVNPAAAQRLAMGAYPFSEERWWEPPWPWESKMMGSPVPVAGAVTRTWRAAGRPGTGRTTGL
jgi:hypothetical protein